MKHLILPAFVFFFLACIPYGTCNAQENRSFPSARAGIKGGLNFSNLNIQDANNVQALIGFNLGLFAKLPLASFLAIQPEISYTTKGSEVAYNNVFATGTARFGLNYLELPVLVVINPIDIVNIHFGPYISYLLNGTVKNVSNVSSFDFENNINNDDYNRFDAGLALGAGIDLGSISIGARYSFGLTKIGRERSFLGTTYTFPDARNSVFSIYASLALN